MGPGSSRSTSRRRESVMRTKTALYLAVAPLLIALAWAAPVVELGAQQPTPPAVRSDGDNIGGIVRSARGPEAGVWVIAETTELPTKYAKMVVTDDQGRYVIPDLPTANYSVWVRGYGLVDSPKVRARPGQRLDLTAVSAPNERAAAHYYPASYWYTLMKIPPAKKFGRATRGPNQLIQEHLRPRM